MKKFLLLLALALIITPVSYSKADGEVVIDNDGKPRKKSKLYGKCAVAPSFKGVEYYDCYIPYELKVKEVGGYATKFKNGCHKMDSSTLKSNVSVPMARQWSKFYTGCHSTDRRDGFSISIDKNGTEYYAMAVQGYFVGRKNRYYPYSDANRGQIIDVILTDGTVIHFVLGDVNADDHTNCSTFSTLHYKQYKNLFSACNGNCIEIWGNDGCCDNFKKKYNIGNGKNQNKIAYYRCYKAKIKDSPKLADEKYKTLSWNAGKVTVDSDPSALATSKDSDVAGTDSSSKAVDTSGAGGLNTSFDANGVAVDEALSLPDGSGLDANDKYNLMAWKESVDSENASLPVIIVRRVIVFVGIVIIVWSVLLYLAYQFDRINNFIDTPLLQLISFGKLDISPDDRTSTYQLKQDKVSIVTHKDIIFISLTGIMIGMIILTGKIYILVNGFIKLAHRIIELF